MNHASKRALIIAFIVSLLIHALLLTGVKFSLPLNMDDDTTIIEARLQPMPKPAPPLVLKPAAPKKSHHVTKPPAPTIITAHDVVPAIEPAAVEPTAAEPNTAAPVTDDMSAPDTPTLNSLPSTLELQYKVVKGEDGFGIGRATYIWVSKNGGYTLTSITHGTGIFSLLQPGNLVQISQGKITPFGLAPDDFWIQRGRATPDKSTAAHFDYARKTVTITKDNNAYSVPLEDNAQDILSVIFQLVVRSPFSEDMLLHVTSGKSLKPYHAIVVGEEHINSALGEINTLHIQRPAEEGEDAIDMWLATDYNFAPVKIRIDHSKYGIVEQLITGMKTGE
ncbi:MAG: DUF3108 domain-containing protein [Sulfuriferula sp.]